VIAVEKIPLAKTGYRLFAGACLEIILLPPAPYIHEGDPGKRLWRERISSLS
jgi:hypothetical protein